MKSSRHDFNLFHDLDHSCTRILREKNVNGEARVVPGGVEVKLFDWTSSTFSELADYPIKGFDFSETRMPPVAELLNFKISTLATPANCLLNLREWQVFDLNDLRIDGAICRDFECLSLFALKFFSAAKTQFADLAYLANSSLSTFRGDHCQLHDLGPLSGHGNLQSLSMLKCNLEDLSPLEGLPLQKLNLSGNAIFDLSPISQCPIESLEIRATRVESLDPLADCPLKAIHLPGSPIEYLGGIAQCPIEDLNIIGLKIKDFTCLEEMPLKRLYLSPDKLEASEVLILERMNLAYLIGPGDPTDQTKVEFFDKYSLGN